MRRTKISEYVDDAIAALVVSAGTGCAVYITYTTGKIPEFFLMGFGMVLAYFFKQPREE